MPELPEAETIVRGLRTVLPGRRIEGVEVLRPDVLRSAPGVFVERIGRRVFEDVTRRGKNVVAPLSDGYVMAVNLGMTGRLLTFPAAPRRSEAPRHPAVRWSLDDGGVLVFDDVRRFGTVECLTSDGWRARSRAMGREPLARGFTGRSLYTMLRRSRAPVRSFLLDQRRIAGVGNIYANEALYLSGIDPRTPAHELDARAAARLHRALRRVLREAIRAGGTTLRDYRTTEGGRGRYGAALRVYGREGRPCPRCRTPIERVVLSNRSAFLCPRCQFGRQPEPRRGGTPHDRR